MADTYVVTGGAGFIGSHIAERLLKEGHSVRVVDNMITGRQSNLEYLQSLGGDLSIYKVSITDSKALAPIFSGTRVVFHQAALASVPRSVEDPVETHEHNITGTLNVLMAARDAGVKRVVYAASSAAYGDGDFEYAVETILPRPISPYGVSKLVGEHYCQMFYDVYGLETVALRYFNVFGERQDPTSQYAAVIPKFMTRMLDGKPPIIFGDGEQTRDFMYVKNIVHGNMLAAEAPEAPGQMMNLSTGDRISLLQLVDALNEIMGTNMQPIHEATRAGDIKHSRANVDKVCKLLGFAPIIDFAEGLSRTINWYREMME